MEVRGAKVLLWARRSIIGHVLLFGLSWSGLVSPVFVWLSYAQRTLTLVWGVEVIAVCGMGGIAAGSMCWYLISQPYLRKLKSWLTSESEA
jgi:hypothetical protein